ncbi:hypothetical protein [Aliidiomarina celeris]|uniref:hypothetical protein n=1 Tax=Aliidiomarina celeris TaxID=2249428 RepID=UPI0013005C36|nr:hypothetical protein [Aliidiomarina celeris]
MHAFEAVKEWLEHEEQKSLNKAFLAWMKGVLLPSRWEHIDFAEVDDLEGVHSMLEETVKEWKRDWKREGLAEGRAEGRVAGQRQLLLMQLNAKFGELSDEHKALIEAADEESLRTWSVALLTAESLEAVF